MNLSEIRKLVKLVETSQINELEIEEEGSRIKIVKGQSAESNNQYVQAIPAVQPNASMTLIEASASAPAPVPKSVEEESQAITSPMVGTFYSAQSPEAPPYVKVGDQVKPGQVLCIIEAMKLMNEIECEVSGVVLEINANNAEPVEFDQTLFRILQN
jgi:acetyl-CoA carboxylase biotin carboxyl carrier protein